MDIEKLKKEFIKLKSGELEYLDNIAKLGYQKTFSQEEKLNIYRKLKFYENIPLLSYIFLGGKCKCCKKRISIIRWR